MRTRNLFIGGLALLGGGAIYMWTSQTPAVPSGSLRLVGYQTRTNGIVAMVELKNTGSSALNCSVGAGGVCYSVTARVRGEETNFYVGGGWTLSRQLVWPGNSAGVRVSLPAGTETWRCSIAVRGPSAAAKAAVRMLETGIWKRIYPVSEWSLNLFSPKESAEKEIESATFRIETNAFLSNP
jgi:hypothetical protein